jgi:hypothetical protein
MDIPFAIVCGLAAIVSLCLVYAYLKGRKDIS